MARNVELRIDGVDATKAAFSSAEARSRTLNRNIGALSKKQIREIQTTEKAHARAMQQASREGEQRSAAWRTSLNQTGVALGVLSAGLEVLRQRGADVERISTAFERLTLAQGLSADKMKNEIRAATRGLVTDMDAMGASNKALLLGLPITESEMGDMAAAAVTLGQAMGQKAGKSLDDLITALGRASPLILDNLGLTVKVGDANKAYAKELGKSASKLTEAEKKQAFFNAAMDAARIKTAELGGVQSTAAGYVDQLKVSATNLSDSFLASGQGVLAALEGTAAAAGGMILALANGPAAMTAIKAAGPALSGALGFVAVAARAMWAALGGPVAWIVGGLALIGTAAYAAWAKWGGGADEARAKTEDLERATAAAIARNSAQIQGALEKGTSAIQASRDQMAAYWAEAGEQARAQDEKNAAAAEQAAKEVTDEFWRQVDEAAVKNAETSAWGLRSAPVQAAIRQAGSDAGLEWSAAFMTGPGGVMTTVPQNMMTLADDGSWTLAGGQGGEKMAAAVGDKVSAWSRGGGAAGMFSGLTGAVTQFATGGWKSGVMSLVQTATNFLPPGMAQAAQIGIAAVSAIWKAVKKPSEAELAARKDVDDYEAAAIEGLSEAQLAEAAAAGWESVADAGFLIKIRDQYGEVGLSAEQAEADVAAYWAAIESGDLTTIDAYQEKWDGLGVSIEEAAAATEAAWEASSSAAASAFYKAEDAGTSAYDKIYAEAIESGAGQEQAVAKATAASLAATAKVLAAEGLKYARIAGFDAAMALGAHATQAERNAAAATAAAGAIASWDAAMVAVVASDKAAADAIEAPGGGPARTQEAIDKALLAKETGALPAAEAAFAALPGVADTMAGGVNTALGRIEREIQIDIRHHTTYSSSGSSGEGGGGEGGGGEFGGGRAGGGPVRGGMTYRVGERGTEYVTMPGNGFVTPNSGIPTAEDIAQALARVWRENPPVALMSRDAVTDSTMENWPDRQALHGYGGRG